MPLIEVKNLQKTYTSDGIETPVLHGLNFTIDEGEFVAIIGPSGSGKSTLLHILGFLDNLTAGDYYFANKSVQDYTPAEAALIRNQKLGFVFQAFNLLPRSSVYDNVELPLMYSNIPSSKWPKKIKDAIEAVGLSHRAQYESSQLSGGEKQRVAIARALVMNPTIIFADEPTGNLDSKSGQIIMSIMQNLNEKQKHTVILITHETETAETAKRIIKIKDGLIESDYKVATHRQAKINYHK